MKTDLSNTGCIQKYIGSDFDKVVKVADHIPLLENVIANLPEIIEVNGQEVNIKTVADNIKDITNVSENMDAIKDMATWLGTTVDKMIVSLLRAAGYDIVGDSHTGGVITKIGQLVVHNEIVYRFNAPLVPYPFNENTQFIEPDWVASYRGSVKDWLLFDKQLLEAGDIPNPNNEPDTDSEPRRIRAIKNMIRKDGDAISVTAYASTTPRLLEDRFADIVNPLDYGAKGDGVTDDWLALQTAITTARNTNKTCFIPKGIYVISRPLFLTADTVALAQATSKGELVQTAHDYNNFKIVGSGMQDTVIKYTGVYHALQIGSFKDTSLTGANFASWYGHISDLRVEAGNGTHALLMVWGHHYTLDRVALIGGSEAVYEHINTVRDANFTYLCLWNSINHSIIQGQDNTKVGYIMRGNSLMLLDTYVFGGRECTVQIIGARHNLTRLSCENTSASGLTPYFVKVEGGCSIYDPDLETGGGGVANAFLLKTDNQVVIQNPTIVGVTGKRYDLDPSITNPRVMLIGAETQQIGLAGNEMTIKALGAGSIAMPSSRVLLKQKAVTKTITAGAHPAVGAYTNLAVGDTTSGYGSGICLDGLKVVITGSSGTYPVIDVRLYTGNDTFIDLPTFNINSNGTYYYDSKDFNFRNYLSDGKYIRLIQARAKSGGGGTIDVTAFYTEVN